MADLTDEIAQHVIKMFHEHPHPDLLYHNLEHTRSVVSHALEIAGHYTLTSKELLELIAAAWFHDTGHLFGDMAGHEQKSVRLMVNFLLTKDLGLDSLTNISACIMATQWPARPATIVEEILCDADTYHLGTDKFIETDQTVWDEMELRLHMNISDKTEKSLRFLLSHRFFTAYCRELLADGKNRNILLLQKKRGINETR